MNRNELNTRTGKVAKHSQSLAKERNFSTDRPHLLVMDDDPTFLTLVRREAALRGIPITVCSSVRELSAIGTPALFDAAVVDYYLDNVKDYFNGAEVASVFGPTPVLLISSTNHCVDESNSWPTTVRKFLNKKSGVATILDMAIQLGHGNPRKENL